jgi:regulator of sirC expression with transglutaminase-like and TPR domain
MQFAAPTPLAYFSSLVASDDSFPLLEAAASLAQDEHPEADTQSVLGQVDQLLARLKKRIAADASGIDRLRLLNHFFYSELSFGPALNDFYDPDNSYLHVILRTRRGIPISLAVLWLELAQGLGLRARGVSFPGHFLCKVTLPKGQVVIDPLSGLSMSREELSERLEPHKLRSGLTGEFEMPMGLYLQAANPRDVIARMLMNLREIHKSEGNATQLRQVLDRLVVLQPQAWSHRRDRGLVLSDLGHFSQAAEDLQAYLANAEDILDMDLISQRLVEARRESQG